jgi:hypothetical protein
MFKEFGLSLMSKNETIFDYYRTGESINTIMPLFESVGLEPNPDLISLYEWKGGLKNWEIPTGQSSIFAFGVFAPLEIAIKSYKDLVFTQKLIKPSFFPILVEDFLLINIDPESKSKGALYFFSPSLVIMNPQKMFLSIEHFLRTHIEFYEKNIISFDHEKKRIINFDQLLKTGKEMNPLCEFWQ